MSIESLHPTEAPPDKRQLILDATLSLLSSRGFHGFSIKQVADEAKVAAGTIYLYFKDKNALMEELHLEIIQRMATAVFEGFDPGLEPFDQYRFICTNLWQFCINNPKITFSKGQFDHLPPEVLRNQYDNAKRMFQPLMNLFEQCRLQGMLSPMPDEVLASLAIENYCQLARKHQLGLVDLDEALLEQVILSSWKAILADK